MSNCNKIVIFDWGGVIENHNYDKYNISQAIIDIMKYYNCNLSDAEILNICSKGSKLKSTSICNNEKITIDWFNNIKDKLKLNCTFEQYKKAYYEYGKKIPYHEDVVEYAHSLKSKCKIGVFSNLVKLDEQRINDQINLSMFDYVFLSYEIGYRKPNLNSYKIVEKKLNTNPKNILFIDDTKENIESAKQRGWNVCNANGYELDKIKECVEEFLQEQ